MRMFYGKEMGEKALKGKERKRKSERERGGGGVGGCIVRTGKDRKGKAIWGRQSWRRLGMVGDYEGDVARSLRPPLS